MTKIERKKNLASFVGHVWCWFSHQLKSTIGASFDEKSGLVECIFFELNFFLRSSLFIMQIFLTTAFVRKIQDGDNFHFSYFLFKFTFYISFRVYKLFFLNTPVSWSFPVRKLKKCPKSEKFRINCQICIFSRIFLKYEDDMIWLISLHLFVANMR